MSDQDELRAIAERLLELTEGGALSGVPALPTLSDQNADDRYLVGMAHAIYASRRQRDRTMEGELFGEPAWDMWLDLFVRGARGERTPVTSLCVASGVPTTTALRWVGTLQEAGLVVREGSEHDRRVAYLKLSPAGFTAIRRCLLNCARHVRPAQNLFLLQEHTHK